MPMTQKEMVKLLKQHGFVEVKSEGKGSHIKMKKPGVRSIPVPKGELKKGTETTNIEASRANIARYFNI